MGKGKKPTIGFHYMFDLLMGLCRGPINELVAIKVGEKIAWKGVVQDGSMQAIKKPDLFGGEKKEGGIQGPFRVFMGDKDQILPGDGSINCGSSGPMKGTQTLKNVKTQIGGRVSEFRGVTMVWFTGLISSMNPYPKEWSFRGRRSDKGWYDDVPWYPKMARIVMDGISRTYRGGRVFSDGSLFGDLMAAAAGDGALVTTDATGAIHAMNPAHIIFECYTNPAWGRGLPWSMMDENSFRYGANLHCDEGFGLCFRWQRKDDIDTFIASVQSHVDASTYLDPETGLMTYKPWRNDYVVEDLPMFTPTSGLLSIDEDDSSSQDATFNEVIGKGIDPETNEEFQLRTHNLAARQSQGAPNPETKDYPGIPTKSLLARVIQRDLKKHASGLKKLWVTLDRRAWKLRPGMCFRIGDPRREIGQMVLRAVEIDDTDKKGKIKVKAIQDVFGLPATSFVTPTDPNTPLPPDEALPPVISKLFEGNYRDLRLRMSLGEMIEFEGNGMIGMVSLSPDPLMYQYELATRASGEVDFETRGTATFTGAAVLAVECGPYDTALTIAEETDITDDLVGQVVLIGEEQMGVEAYDAVTHILTVSRGVGDTIPVAHVVNEIMWTVDDDASTDQRSYVPGEIVEAAALTIGGGEVLSIADATILEVEIVGRWNMPYPPGDVRVDADPALTLAYDAFYPEPIITWTHRDRVIQQDQIVAHEEASVGPEAGTTYNIRVYDIMAPDVVLRDVPGIAGVTWTYDAAMQALDGAPLGVYIELESERDGLVSYQHYRFFVALSELTGYGFGYGNDYGGA